MQSWLTDSPEKAARYPDDIYFRESWRQAAELLPDPQSVLCTTSYLLIKPETMATRRVELLLTLIRDRGYLALELLPATLDRHRVRALWQYQLNDAPLATLAAVDLVTSAGAAALVLLAEQPGAGEPGSSASRRLSAMKGSSAEARRPDHLRTLLGATGTTLLSYLHLPDEPADFVRELGIWFDQTDRARIYRLLADAGRSAEPEPAILAAGRRLEQRSGTTDLDLGRALAGLAAAAGPADQARLRQLRDWLSDQPQPAADLLHLVHWLSGLAEVPIWDRVLVAAHLVRRQPAPDRAPLR